MNRSIILTLLFNAFTLSVCRSQGVHSGSVDLLSVEYSATGPIDVQIKPLGKNGLLAYYRDTNNKDKNNDNWTFCKYDTMLNQQWTRTITVPNKNQYYHAGYISDSILYLLYVASPSKKYNFSIFILDLKNNKTEQVDDDFGKYFTRNFVVIGDIAYFYILANGDNYLCSFNLKTREKFSFPIDNYGKEISPGGITMEGNSSNFDLYFSSSGKVRSWIIKTVYPNEKRTEDFAIETKQGKNSLKQPVVMKINDNTRILAGTFIGFNYTIKGIYIAKYEGKDQKYIKFINYEVFHSGSSNLFVTGIESGDDVRMHEIIKKENNFLLLGEVYHFTSTNLMAGMGSVMMQTSATIADHGLVANFDFNGNELWDYGFKMDNLEGMDNGKKILLRQDDKQLNLIYPKCDSVDYKLISESGVTTRQSKPIEPLKSAKGKKMAAADLYVNYWYDNNFLYWGSEKIKGQEIYFAKKISF